MLVTRSHPKRNSVEILARDWRKMRRNFGEHFRRFSSFNFQEETLGKSNVGFQKGGSCNSRFVLKPDVAIASEVSIFSKDSFAITDFLAKGTQLANYCGKPPLPGTSPHSRFSGKTAARISTFTKNP